MGRRLRYLLILMRPMDAETLRQLLEELQTLEHEEGCGGSPARNHCETEDS